VLSPSAAEERCRFLRLKVAEKIIVDPFHDLNPETGFVRVVAQE
jgi:hypothetical protein